MSLFADSDAGSGGAGARSADVLMLAHEPDEPERGLGASRVGVGVQVAQRGDRPLRVADVQQSWQASV